MTILAAAFHEILGLFVDDQGLALSVLGVAAAAFVLAFVFHAPSVVTAAAIVLGCTGALIVSVLRGGAR
jgi:hypothetical protein